MAAPSRKPKPKKPKAKAPAKAPKRPAAASRRGRPQPPKRVKPEAAPPPPPPSRVEGAAQLLAQAAQLWASATSALVTRAGAVAIHSAREKAAGAWLLVTTGLHDRGFELCLRAVSGPGEVAPPAWAVELLKHVVDWAQDGPTELGPALLTVPQAVVGEAAADLGAVSFAPAPGLKPAHGVVPYAVVPLLRDEARLVREWSPQGFVEVLAKADPRLVADPTRVSMLLSPRARAAIEARVEREGSALGALDVASSVVKVQKDAATWELDPDGAQAVVALLKGRLGHGRPFEIRGAAQAVRVLPGDAGAIVATEPLTLKLNLQAARAIRATLRGDVGTFRWDELPGLTILVRAP